MLHNKLTFTYFTESLEDTHINSILTEHKHFPCIYGGTFKSLKIFNEEHDNELRNAIEVYDISDDSESICSLNCNNPLSNRNTNSHSSYKTSEISLECKEHTLSPTTETCEHENIDNHLTSSNSRKTEPTMQILNHSSEAIDLTSQSTPLILNDNTEPDPPELARFKLGVWNISGLKGKLNGNADFEEFISMFDVIGFVETWAEENDICAIEGFAEPFTSVREKHPNAWKNSGGIAIYLKQHYQVFFPYNEIDFAE